jgi:hypothetical protein
MEAFIRAEGCASLIALSKMGPSTSYVAGTKTISFSPSGSIQVDRLSCSKEAMEPCGMLASLFPNRLHLPTFV